MDMGIAGKLFGMVGHAPTSIAPCRGATACPGFAWSYSLELARSHEAQVRRAAARRFAETYALPLAA
jgi:hypothetical protein